MDSGRAAVHNGHASLRRRTPPPIAENVLELFHFEDLPLGGEWTTRRRTITEAALSAFVALSGDYNPLYTDAEHARAGPFGAVVAPGGLIAAVTLGLGSIDVPQPAAVALVGMSWRFTRPVRTGDTIRSRWRLNRKRDVEDPGRGLVVWQVEVENQRDEVVATAEVVRLVARAEQPVDEAARPSRSRRRRRRGAAEPAGPEPAPAPALAPAAEAPPAPPPSPAPAAPGELPAAQAPPASRRRRRAASPAPVEPPAEPAPPGPPPTEPAEAAPPTPAARRRRRRAAAHAGPADAGGGGEPAGETKPAVESPPPAGPDSPAASEPPAPPPAPAPSPAPSPPPDAAAEPEAAAGASGGLAGVLRRLRGT